MKGREIFLEHHSRYSRWATESGPGSKFSLPVFYHIRDSQDPERPAILPLSPLSLVEARQVPPFPVNLHPPSVCTSLPIHPNFS